jgi:hypothetical protein
MNVYRGTVASVTDFAQGGMMQVNLPQALGSVEVTYVSPMNNVDGGIFAPPTPNSEVLVMEIDADEVGGKAGGYYYLGSIVGNTRYLSDGLPPALLDKDFVYSPQSAEDVKMEGGEVDFRGFGVDAKSPPTMPIDVMDAYANQVVPEKMCFLDKGRNGLLLRDMHHGGHNKNNAWMTMGTTLQSGDGKHIDLNSTPAQDQIRISTGTDKDEGGEDFVFLAGKQNAEGAEFTTTQAGEFRVDSQGPTNIVSRENGVEVRAQGLNIEIKNTAGGLNGPNVNDRRLTKPGGGNAVWIPGPDAKEALWPPLPLAAAYNTHPDPSVSPPGSGGNPVEKASETWGCVNIVSEYNNINLEALAPDSVIHVNAPHTATKIVVTTGGTVDIVATGKISLTSGQKIELNAPFIDINSGVRVDID